MTDVPHGTDDDLAPALDGTTPAGELKRAAAVGVQWTFVGTIASNAGRLLFSLVLARMVGPHNFGIVSQGTLYVTFTLLLLDQGFGTALIQRRHVDDEDIGSVTLLNIALTIGLVAVTLVAAPAVAEFFDSPELTAVLRVLSLSVVLKGMQVVPNALVNRQLRFKALAVIQVVSVVVGGIAGIVAAAAGAEYWALVVQTLAIDGLALVAITVLVGGLRLRGSVARLRGMAGFSVNLMGAHILGYSATNLDNILIADRLSARMLAFYAVSYRLVTMPLQMMGSVVNRVSIPIFSRTQDEPERVRAWYLTATRLTAAVTFPFFTLLTVAAADGIVLAFGDAWRPATFPLQVLGVVGFSRGVRLLLPALCIALGRTDINLRWSAVTLAVAVPSYLYGLEWGIDGVAVAFAIVSVTTGIGHIRVTSHLVDVGLSDYGRVVAPLAVCSGVMAAIWLGTRWGVDALGGGRLVGVLAATPVACVGYLLALRRLAPASVTAGREVWGLMRSRA